jgi:hypothetical protein
MMILNFDVMPSCQTAFDWTDLPHVQVANNGPLFDNPDPFMREPIDDLANLPVTDDDGCEIPVFNNEGFRVPRRKPAFGPDNNECGIWFDLPHINDLFVPDPDNDELYLGGLPELESNELEVTPYPQAFTRRFGHFQANTVPCALGPFIHDVNVQISPPDTLITTDNYDVASRQDRAQVRFTGDLPLKVIGSQGYNATTHRGRGPGDRWHEVQQGIATGAMSSIYCTTSNNKATGKVLQDKIPTIVLERNGRETIQCQYPHTRTISRLTSAVDESVRLEINYVLDIQAMDPELRSGL